MPRKDGSRTTPGLVRVTVDVEQEVIEQYGIRAVRMGLTRAVLMRATLRRGLSFTGEPAKENPFDRFVKDLSTEVYGDRSKDNAESPSIVEEAMQDEADSSKENTATAAVGMTDADYDEELRRRVAESQAKMKGRQSSKAGPKL